MAVCPLCNDSGYPLATFNGAPYWYRCNGCAMVFRHAPNVREVSAEEFARIETECQRLAQAVGDLYSRIATIGETP